MGWWIYLSGVIITALIWVLIAYRDWNKGNDTTMENVLSYSLSSLLSWAGLIVIVIACLLWFLDEHANDVIIEGKKH